MAARGQHMTGAASEQIVSAHLLLNGCEVFLPVLTQSRADLIYLKHTGEAVKVQIKTGTKVKTGPYTYEQVRLVSRNQKAGGLALPYSSNEIDELWVVGTHIWCFPQNEISGKTSLFLGSDNPDPKSWRRTYDPDAFIVKAGSWEDPMRDRLL